jgi:aminoglycoside phosphotransferase (APT) family kinase protein
MLIPAQRLLQGLNVEFTKLQATFSDSGVDGSAPMAIASALMTLLNRELGGAATVRAQLAGLDAALASIAAPLSAASEQAAAEVEALRTRMATLKESNSLGELEQELRVALATLQTVLSRLNVEPGVPSASREAISHALSTWESADLLAQGASRARDAAPPTEITRDNLEAYLRDRFAEPALAVTSFQPLAGGFGKQTILFAVEGKALGGELVMRRDMGERPTMANDCHLIRDEYPVIKAAHGRGFPAPEALWLDTEHKLLPGGDFIIMRKSLGRLPGNFFGAQGAVPASLTDTLADVMARLHTLPPLTELGDLTDAIRSERWSMSKGECTERYIRGMYELFLRSEHWASPALTAIYGWLLDNVPDRSGRPALLHGDIGFHNFLFEGEKLSAVLDWEFAHIGDPAEELGYVKVTVGNSIDWDRLMARYVAAGGEPVDDKTLRFFQVWAYMRNATASNLASALFIHGHYDELKLAFLPVAHFPNFIRGAQALIDGV